MRQLFDIPCHLTGDFSRAKMLACAKLANANISHATIIAVYSIPSSERVAATNTGKRTIRVIPGVAQKDL